MSASGATNNVTRIRGLIALAKGSNLSEHNSTHPSDTNDSEETSELTHLKSRLSKLEGRIDDLMMELTAKDDLLKDAEKALEELLMVRQPASDSADCRIVRVARVVASTASTDIVNMHVSDEVFVNELHSWRNQIWFSPQVPPPLAATFLKLSQKLPDIYKSRTQPLTLIECTKIVDELRRLWITEAPNLITTEMKKISYTVYASKADAKTGYKPQKCEAVHLLVYLVRKLYNKATITFAEVKRNRVLSSMHSTTPDDLDHLKIMQQDAKGDNNSKEQKLRWQDNPFPVLQTLLEDARGTIRSEVFLTVHDIELAIKGMSAKLTGNNIPKLPEGLKQLASIIALKEHASSRNLCVHPNVFIHRQDFRFKMLEHWNQCHWEKSLNDYRYSIFTGINSLLMYSYLCRGVAAVEGVLKELEGTLKPALKREFERALEDLNMNSKVQPLLVELQFLATTTDYASFFCKSYVLLLQFLGDIEDSMALPETVVLNLLADLGVSGDLGSLSDLEKNNYIKVISVIATGILTPHHCAAASLTGNRLKYCKAAQFISIQFSYLLQLSKLTSEEERLFWFDKPVDGMGAMIDYCSQREKIRNILPLIRLPKLHDESSGSSVRSMSLLMSDALGSPHFPISGSSKGGYKEVNIFSANINDACVSSSHTYSSGKAANGKENSGVEGAAKKMLPAKMKKAEMKHCLESLNLLSTGTKDVLQKRLVDEGGYATEPKRKRHGKRKRSNETSSSEEEDL